MLRINFQPVLFFIVIVASGVLGKPPQKIVGGSYSIPDESAHQVSIRVYGRHHCGGSIISTRHILTAAHCLYGHPFRIEDIDIVTGTTNLYSGGNFHKVQSVKLHPSFFNTAAYSYANDIAVITLKTSIQLDKHQQIIKLASGDFGGSQGIVSGWGYINQATRQSLPYLLKLTTNIINSTYCQMYHRGQLYSSQVCALTAQGSGTCQGDSGGPLSCKGELVGVVSFGLGCGQGYPDVYTLVSYYKDWIKQTMTKSGVLTDVNNNINNNDNNNDTISNNNDKDITIVDNISKSVPSLELCAPTAPNKMTYYMFYNGMWYQVIY